MLPIYSASYKYYSFEFFLDQVIPEKELVTCVFCLLQNENGDIWLTKNKRGWELPGGHIENDEDYETALKREIMEEVGIEATDFQFVGYKKLTNFEKKSNKRGGFYPFPHSYIIYFTGKSVGERIIPFPSGEDETEDSDLYTYDEAIEIMKSESNHAILQAILNR